MNTITVNGIEHNLADETTLSDLLVRLGLAGRPVVAELNGAAVLPRTFGETIIRPGDKLELIAICAGG
ncbi:sulfur carrier protein ThiS [Akkermansia glycaniphila]|uniref:sulfur carrier protein ThiS n=1 Tax=Akkermansia glycaniphila TaxID=1679444 RepID=UPI001C02ED71|nr:sulfur carrier protein ThiS [Akkermansia glycaniphila]MBT9449686.1 sulfur carrier protein ThiS [Akkermansia glycaniphila]